MKLTVNLAALLTLAVFQSQAAPPRACVGSLPVGTFRFTVTPRQGGPARPVRLVNAILPGYKLRYEPVKLPAATEKKARVAVALVPAKDSEDIVVLEPKPALEPAEWTVPQQPAVVAVVFGPQGLDAKKVDKLAEKQRDLLPQLADYAEQTAQVEALVETLSSWEENRNGRSLDAALSGFSSQYGVSLPKLDPKAPTDQQAALLLRGLMPALSSYDPLASQRGVVMQQSAGLAATVAAMFFGSPVGLAAGGAAMFQNMRTLLFPDTELRSSIAQSLGSDDVALCARPQPAKSRTRLAYLWAIRIANTAPPQVTLAETPNLPIGSKSAVRIVPNRLVHRAYDWRLAPASGGAPIPAPVIVAGDTLTVDLTHVKATPGDYALLAKWDWDEIAVSGKLHLAAFGDLAEARLTPESQDRLIEGSGPVTVKLTGPDFQFIEKVLMVKPAKRGETTVEAPFVLPKGPRAGTQESLEVDLDLHSLPRGSYALRLVQADGRSRDIAFTVLPPNPRIAALRANLGEARQAVRLTGSGLERIESIRCDGAEIELAGAPAGARDLTERQGVVKLRPDAKAGERYGAQVQVRGLNFPIAMPNLLEVAGPRPRLASVKISYPDGAGVALRQHEIPAGGTISLAISAEHLDSTPILELGCEGKPQTISLRPGEGTSKARLDMAGEGILFVSLDPGAVGQSGCMLTATIATEPAGKSDPYRLGRVTRTPRIEEFTLTDQKAGDGLYYGVLKGEGLETIEKTGWDSCKGVPVQSIPAPVAGEPNKQTLRVVLPWPAPEPHAPVYVWLRGESEGRATKAKF